MRYAVLFPGQGSQFVGMGADLFAARPGLLGPAADEVLGWSLEELCRDGPEELLTRTDKAQPALYALSYALWESFQAVADAPPAAMAGHSLGEYTALAAAGAMDYLDGLALVAARGEAMAAAAEASDPSTMAAVVGSPDAVVEEILAQRRESGGRIWAANYNAPGQLVIAGARADVEWLVAAGKELGLRRVIPLTVGGAFHSPFMAPAAESLSRAIADVEFRDPVVPVYANVTAAPVTDIPRSLVSQLTGPVRFVETLEAMAAADIDTFIHLGPGDVTAGLARKIVKGSTVMVGDSVATVEEVAAMTSGGGTDADG